MRICRRTGQQWCIALIMNREWNSVFPTQPGNLWILMEYNWLCDHEHAQCETKARASRAEVQQMLIKKKQSQTYKARQEGYVVIDLETTGLNSSSDEIIELAAIRIINHKIADQLEVLSKNRKRSSKK